MSIYANKPNNDHRGYIDERKAAAILDISPRTFRRLVDAGDMPTGFRIGRRLVRWRLADIIKAAERRAAH
jgi:predicted DNA-binding transcriptional regulator AlpA